MKQPNTGGKNSIEGFLDDILFAPARGLDQHGHELGASPFKKLYSSAAFKIGCFTTVGLTAAFTQAVGNAHTWVDFLDINNPLYKLGAGTIFNLAAISFLNWHHQLVKPVEYYFDTWPDYKIPLTNTTIHTLLEMQRKDGLIGAWTAATGGIGLAVALPFVMPAVLVPYAAVAVVPLASGAITIAADKAAQWWRAYQSLSPNGNWNVLITRPDPTPDMILVPEPA